MSDSAEAKQGQPAFISVRGLYKLEHTVDSEGRLWVFRSMATGNRGLQEVNEYTMNAIQTFREYRLIDMDALVEIYEGAPDNFTKVSIGFHVRPDVTLGGPIDWTDFSQEGTR